MGEKQKSAADQPILGPSPPGQCQMASPALEAGEMCLGEDVPMEEIFLVCSNSEFFFSHNYHVLVMIPVSNNNNDIILSQ